MRAHPSLELASNLAFQTINYLLDRAILKIIKTQAQNARFLRYVNLKSCTFDCFLHINCYPSHSYPSHSRIEREFATHDPMRECALVYISASLLPRPNAGVCSGVYQREFAPTTQCGSGLWSSFVAYIPQAVYSLLIPCFG